eukprot:scaffold868_cov351-Pavlova_lutheri.AAC.2
MEEEGPSVSDVSFVVLGIVQKGRVQSKPHTPHATSNEPDFEFHGIRGKLGWEGRSAEGHGASDLRRGACKRREPRVFRTVPAHHSHPTGAVPGALV